MRKAFFICFLFFQFILRSQNTASFTASVTIVEPVKISTVKNLNFSNIRAGSGGMVILTPEGFRRGYGGVELGEELNTSPAIFNITGQSSTKVTFRLPDGEHILSNGNENIIIRDFTTDWTDNIKLNEGKNFLKVGASIIIKAEQESGIYTSQRPLEIIVNYD